VTEIEQLAQMIDELNEKVAPMKSGDGALYALRD